MVTPRSCARWRSRAAASRPGPRLKRLSGAPPRTGTSTSTPSSGAADGATAPRAAPGSLSCQMPQQLSGCTTKADRQGARSGTAAAVPAVLRKGPGRSVDQVEGVELNLPLAQESWAYSSSPAAASMGRKSSSKVRESEKYQLKSWWSPIWCRVGVYRPRFLGHRIEAYAA